VYSAPVLRPTGIVEPEPVDSYSDVESEAYNTQGTSSADATASSTPITCVESSEADSGTLFGPQNSFWYWSKSPPQERQQKVSDLELLNHFLNHTSKTLAAESNDRGGREGWETVIPRLAFKHESVAHALRAVSTLHLASELLRSGTCCIEAHAGDSHEFLRNEAEFRYGRALVLHQADLAKYDSTMSDRILATSALLFVFNMAYEDCAGAEGEVYTCQVVGSETVNMALDSALPKWLRFARGIRTVRIMMAQDHQRSVSELERFWDLRGSEVIPDDVLHLQDTDPVFLKRIGALHRPSAYWHRMYEPIGRSRRAAAATLDEFLQSCGSGTHTTSCRNALQFLVDNTIIIFDSNVASQSSEGSHHLRLYDRNPLRTIFGLPAVLDSQFIQLLDANDVRALMVYAHFLVFMILVEGAWFAGRIGGMEIDRMARAMEIWEKKNYEFGSETNRLDWRMAMRWPLDMVKRSRQAD
jgi:hypothetical protein